MEETNTEPPYFCNKDSQPERVNRNSGGGIGAAGDYSHNEEITRIEEIGRMLKSTQQRLNEASMKAHLLNVDVVTLFDPIKSDQMRTRVEECRQCVERMKEKDRQVEEQFLSKEDIKE
ncbi:PREDICTED: uncharacterized protein LOC100631981 [Amphimedon queenslandica]|uniref:Uncharacterized protein n=1 Tax=Amphimedon queenslandica TaxID=400682 RepID=A0A1X7VMK0_AMPQE|nr:PREDICTED: uncharacterized protein LOC100631981 [Amphimedon queenslandica]|eukprot:XP_003383887.1 PREDICTED: uncharacterized protein LOC100631981 [Amphimedon queenslandica]